MNEKGCGVVDLTFEEGGEGAFHQHPHEQISYLVSGSIEYEIKGVEKVILHSGDSIYVAPNQEHGCRALEKSRLLDIFYPGEERFSLSARLPGGN